MRPSAVPLAWALVLAANTAAADAPDDEKEPEAPPRAEPAPTPRREPPRAVTRVALAGAYRGIYDLSAFAGGLGFSLGSEATHVGGYFNARALLGSTLAGLRVLDIATTGTVEFHYGGPRFGFGGGIAYFGIRRATTGGTLASVGALSVFRVGYDFADAASAGTAATAPRAASAGREGGAWILLDLEAQIQFGPVIWGPTLLLGWRF
jgi:hypothetical protein